MNAITEDYDKRESPRFGYSLNFGINYKANNWFGLKTGVGIKNIGEKVEYLAMLGQSEFNNQTISVYGDEIQTVNNKFLYLSFPFDFQVSILNKKRFTLGVNAGSGLDILLRKHITNNQEKYKTDTKYELSEISKLATNIHEGIFVNLKLNEKLTISITPQFAKYVTPNLTFTVDENQLYVKINQYNYYGQLKVGIVFNK